MLTPGILQIARIGSFAKHSSCSPQERLARNRAQHLASARLTLRQRLGIDYLHALDVDRAIIGIQIIHDLRAVMNAVGVVTDSNRYKLHVTSAVGRATDTPATILERYPDDGQYPKSA